MDFNMDELNNRINNLKEKELKEGSDLQKELVEEVYVKINWAKRKAQRDSRHEWENRVISFCVGGVVAMIALLVCMHFFG